MNFTTLVRNNLAYFRRTNLAVLLGVAAAVAVLAGALLVGDSVRASLRNLALGRLGAADLTISGTTFFRDALAADLQSDARFASAFEDIAPMILLPGVVTRDENSARAGGVQVYGVDDRFWKFHRLPAPAQEGNDALVSPALAAEIGAKPGETILVRIEKPSAIPAESLHSRKDEMGRAIRVTMRAVLPAASLGEFSLRPQQGSVRAVFLPLAKLQRNLEQEKRVNVLLASLKPGRTGGADLLTAMLREKYQLADLGLKLRPLPLQRAVALESESAVIGDRLADASQAVAARGKIATAGALTYLANAMRVGDRSVPYSLVAAVGPEAWNKLSPALAAEPASARSDEAPIVLNEWAARDLSAKAGDALELEYYLWQPEGRLATQTARFRVRGIVPMEGAALDRNLSPDYPGITDTESLADWDPPFPIDLGRVRPKDEEYWHQYRTTPKAFLPLSEGQRLWASRYGKLTSLRFYPASASESADLAGVENTRTLLEKELRAALDPVAMGFDVRAIREQSLQASRGATDFGEYFAYFSFFLVISALMLTTLFFRLGIEQRLREIGLLRAMGYSIRAVRGLFLREGAMLALLGSAAGLAGAVAYGALMMYGLRTWWVGAVGTTELRLHVTPQTLVIGAGGGIAAALLCIWWTLRRLAALSPRSLLGGALPAADARSGRGGWRSASRLALLFALLGGALLAATLAGRVGATGGFFGAGALLLVAALSFWSAWLKRTPSRPIGGHGAGAMARMGFRNAALRPGRSVLCIALIAASAFIIVSVDAFRRDNRAGALDRHSGTGGYPLLAESLLPIVRDLDSAQGREELNLADEALRKVAFARFRLRPGDDASCLNLYQPRNPRILGASEAFLREGRFAFQASLAATPEEKANPWLLLDRPEADGVVPVIADANSMTYVLHAGLGDVLSVNDERGAPVRMRLVAALADSILQGELVMAESRFLAHFPDQEGYRVFLIDAPAAEAAALGATLEDRLRDYGFDASSTEERLAGFHQVENTYLSTFQTLGGLGLLLGTIGLAAVLLRNVLERRREIALLRAVGYRPAHLSWMVLAENAFLLACGLLTGVACALLAILPALRARGGHLSTASLGLLLLAVLLTGLAASIVAVRAVIRSPLLPALRSE